MIVSTIATVGKHTTRLLHCDLHFTEVVYDGVTLVKMINCFGLTVGTVKII